jgi:selenoprotein W-related protein
VAAELKARLSIEAELIPGKGGIFDVAVDGRVVAAKSRGAFPGEQQIVDAVRAALAG